jgi:hypothetical protein
MSIFTTDQELCTHKVMSRIMGCNHSLGFKEFLNQLNMLYICNRSKVMGTQANGLNYDLRSLSGSELYI